MADGQNSGFDSPVIAPISSNSNSQDTSDQKKDIGAKAGEAVSKLAGAVQQAGSQAKETATSLASEAGEKAKGLLHNQVQAGADFVGEIAQSARVAADSLDQNSPQLAGLVRGVAQQFNDFSETVRGQTVEELVTTTSDFVRRNPALVFSAAAAFGFMLFRVIRAGSSAGPSDSARSEMPQGSWRTDGRMQQAGGIAGAGFQSQPSAGQGQPSAFHGS